MKKVALFVIAALVFSIFAPRAQAQPFADVPTDIFAFDAVAELAAKGLIEGYPDGTFKGDRAMTRYEMAMVVARLLARIEAIKIPAAAPPQVGKADIDRLQRLLNEFRAELAAQGVRVTAIEEELAAIRARLSNVRITGDLRGRYTVSGTVTPGPDGRMTNSSDGTAVSNYRSRLTFTGQVASNIRATTRFQTGTFGLNTAGSQAGFTPLVFDLAYVDFDPLLGVAWRYGRQIYTLAPVGLSGYGLLFDPGNNGTATADGLLVKGKVGGFTWDVGAWASSAGGAAVGSYSTGLGNSPTGISTSTTSFYTGSIAATLIPGWTFRLSALSQQRNGSAVVLPNTSDFGWAVDANGTLIPGISFGAAFASFTGVVFGGGNNTSNGWTVWSNIDLGAFTGMSTFSPTLGFQYKNYGNATGTLAGGPGAFTTSAPTLSGAMTETFGVNNWNFQGWAATLGLKFTPDLSGTFTYESGNTLVASNGTGVGGGPVPAGATVQEYYASFDYSLATRTTLSLRYLRRTVGGADSANAYRVQLTYSY